MPAEMKPGLIEGMSYQRRTVGDADYQLAVGGKGPPVLLLHGFPQTHFCWRAVTPPLAARHTVVVPDLRGYGATRAGPAGPRGEGFSKREMARDLVDLMAQLGHERFAVVGHDRGARVGYRLALDDPKRVSRLAVINVVPTAEQFDRMGAGPSLGYWPWFFLAQPAPFPERLIGAEPQQFLRYIFESWTSSADGVDEDAFAVYLQALTEAVIGAMCADYRASFHLDRHHDAEDREAGRRIAAPLLAITGAEETQLADAASVWRTWAENVTGMQLPGGHFVPEEAPGELADALLSFLGHDAG